MNIIVCLDDNNGMMFNNRRQSRDKILIEHIIKKYSEHRIYIKAYSKTLFNDYLSDKIKISDNFLSEATDEDFCFVENENILPYLEKIKKIIIYKWNRVYPHDIKFDINLSDWKLLSKADFNGFSHKIITEEIYIK